MKQLLLSVILFLFTCFTTHADIGKLDSLFKAGNTNLYNGNYDDAFSDFLELKKLSESIDDSSRLAESLTSLGEVCRATRQFELGLNFLKQALIVSQQTRDSFFIGKALNRMSAIKFEQKDTAASLRYALQSLQIFNRLHEPNWSANSLNIIGAIYTLRQEYESAIKYYDQSRKIVLTLQDQSDLPNILINIANNYLLWGQFEKGLPYAKEAYELATRNETLAYELESSKMLMQLYQGLGRYKEALKYSENTANLNTQYIKELEKAGQTSIQFQHQNELANKENTYLKRMNEENQRLIKVQRTVFWIVISGLAIVSALLVLLLVQYRQRKDSLLILREKNELVENQKKELVQLNQVKDTLLRIVSHDFRAPLVALHSMIQLLDLGVHSQEEFYQITGKLRKHVHESIDSLDNIIFWSRTQMQGFKMNIDAFDLRAFSEEVVDGFQPELNVKQLRVDNQIPIGITISCDRDVLRIILRNLISNAIKFSHTNGSIFLFDGRENGHVKISLQDQGTGISAEIREKLLSQEHITTLGTHNEKGTGMGLILTRELVTKLGGKINIQSEMNQGSTFTIFIPTS